MGAEPASVERGCSSSAKNRRRTTIASPAAGGEEVVVVSRVPGWRCERVPRRKEGEEEASAGGAVLGALGGPLAGARGGRLSICRAERTRARSGKYS